MVHTVQERKKVKWHSTNQNFLNVPKTRLENALTLRKLKTQARIINKIVSMVRQMYLK